jgi:hypothetical protein
MSHAMCVTQPCHMPVTLTPMRPAWERAPSLNSLAQHLLLLS